MWAFNWPSQNSALCDIREAWVVCYVIKGKQCDEYLCCQIPWTVWTDGGKLIQNRAFGVIRDSLRIVKSEKWFSLTKVKIQIKLPEYLKRRELQYYIMGSSSQMGSSSHILEPLTAAEKYLCNCKKMAFVFKWPKPGTRALTVRWSWNSTVWVQN